MSSIWLFSLSFANRDRSPLTIATTTLQHPTTAADKFRHFVCQCVCEFVRNMFTAHKLSMAKWYFRSVAIGFQQGTVQQHFCIVMILWIFESDHRSLLLNRYYYIEVSVCVCVCAVSCKLVTKQKLFICMENFVCKFIDMHGTPSASMWVCVWIRRARQWLLPLFY